MLTAVAWRLVPPVLNSIVPCMIPLRYRIVCGVWQVLSGPPSFRHVFVSTDSFREVAAESSEGGIPS